MQEDSSSEGEWQARDHRRTSTSSADSGLGDESGDQINVKGRDPETGLEVISLLEVGGRECYSSCQAIIANLHSDWTRDPTQQLLSDQNVPANQ